MTSEEQSRDLRTQPAWQAEDLGLPLPPTPHACSVCLPRWEDVIEYGERKQRVMRTLRSSYPRFVFNSKVQALLLKAESTIAHGEEKVVIFPDRDACQRAQRYVEQRHTSASRLASYEQGTQALVVKEEAWSTVLEYWRYCGEITSSRRAEDILMGNKVPDPGNAHQQLAQIFDTSPEHFFLYESGMAAIYAAHRVASTLNQGKKTLQVDFPYVDSLKIQDKCGTGVVFLTDATGERFNEALERLKNHQFAAVFCEVPCNPCMRTPNLPALAEAARTSGTPLVIDDTIASHYNVDVTPYADLITTSLTKWVSGQGDVMAGAVRVNPSSPLAAELKNHLRESNPQHSRLYERDMLAMAENAKGFFTRMEKINKNAQAIVEFLSTHPAVGHVYHPLLTTPEAYESLKKEGRGHGGLLSFTLKNEKKMPKVHDALAWSKGPSLGTEFSLASPYTLMAHFKELEWAEACGISPYLLRLSVGVEDSETLLDSLKTALEQA